MANKTQLLSNRGIRGDSSYTTSGVRHGLDTIQVDIQDTAHLSTYFQVVEFNPIFTAGKNSISFNGSNLLADGSEIKVEVIDAAGNSLYLASPPASTNFNDIANFTVAIYVFQEVANGPGQIYLVGTTVGGEIVKWTGNISINNTYQNVSRTRFYYSPTIEVEPVLLPVVDITVGSTIINSNSNSGSNSAIINGSCTGYSVSPYSVIIGGGVMAGTTATSQYTPKGVNASGADYRVDWTTFSSTDDTITGFNSQMVGATIILYVYSAVNPYAPTNRLATNKTWTVSNSTQSFTIKKVISTTELQLSSDVVDITSDANTEKFVSSNFIGAFEISYTSTSRINQYLNVPFIGTYNTSSHTTQLVTNEPFFTASMVGNAIQVNYTSLDLGIGGHSSYVIAPGISSSINKIPILSSNFTVLNITNSYNGSISQVCYTLYNSSYKTIYTASTVIGIISSLSSSSPYQSYTTLNSESYSSSVLVQKSYADIVYRNLDTFSGFVARQKLYAKSNIYPGDFELISDTPISPSELLFDCITVNKTYAYIGTFYDQTQVNTYWFPSASPLSLTQTDTPLMSGMTISTSDYTNADGNEYIIAKTTAIGMTNDFNYYPYNATEYNNLSGSGYTSNFIFLEKGVLYSLTTNIDIEKNPSVPARVEFYFTSSLPGISEEPKYNPKFGLLIGKIDVSDKVGAKHFDNVQEFLFTPMYDYYGTLVIVPYQCNVTIANLSLVNYGDYGFSPGGTVIQVPFPVNSANESWTLKSELYDNNSTLIFTTTPIVQAFDPYGASLFGTSIVASTGTGSTGGFPSVVPELAVIDNFYLPGLQLFNPPGHFVSWNPSGGALGYTDLTNVSLLPTNSGSVSMDYINVELNGGTQWGRALAVRYSGSATTIYGRRIYVDPTGIKFTYL